MSIMLDNPAAGFLQVPSTTFIFKPSLTAAGTYQNTGVYRIGFWEFPWDAGGTGCAFLFGHDGPSVAPNGNFNNTDADHWVEVGRTNFSSPGKLRTRAAGSGATQAWITGEQVWTGQTAAPRSAMGESRVFLVIEGIMNAGTFATPDWRMFRVCWPASGGSAATHTFISSGLAAAGYVTTAARFHSQVFSNITGQQIISPAFYRTEHNAVIRGDFPHTGTGGSAVLDTTVIQAIYDGANKYRNNTDLNAWQTVGDVQLYSSFVNGDVSISGSSGLGAWNVIGNVNLNAGTLVPGWTTLCADQPKGGFPYVGFYGGRGAIAPILSGVKSTGVTALEVRWEDYTSGVVVPGCDWAAMTFSGTSTFSGNTPVTPPQGYNYRWIIRDANNPSVVSKSGIPIAIGSVVTIGPAQSQGEKIFNGGTPYESNFPPSGSPYYALHLQDSGGNNNNQASNGGVYTRPSGHILTLYNGGTYTPGLIAAAIRWHAVNPGAPLLIVDMALDTYGIYNQWYPEMLAWTTGSPALPNNMPGAPVNSFWYCRGNLTNLPGLTDGASSGLQTVLKILLQSVVDGMFYYLGTADATDAVNIAPYASVTGGAYATWERNYDGVMADMRATVFNRSPNFASLIFPFGRFNTNATRGRELRDKQYMKAISGAPNFLGGFHTDCMADGNGSPHLRNGEGALPLGEQQGDGNQRAVRHMVNGWAHYLSREAFENYGPMALKFWRDPTTTTVAYIELGWQAGISNPAAVVNALQEVYVSPDGSWTDTITSTGGTGFTAALDTTVHPFRIKLTKGTAWPASGARLDFWRSEIYDTTNGTNYQENESLTPPPPLAKAQLNLCIYGNDATFDLGRGIPIRQFFNTLQGLAQTAPPSSGKWTLPLTEDLGAGSTNVVFVLKSSAGAVLYTSPVTALTRT